MRAGAISSMNDLLGDAQRPRLVPQQRMVEADAVGDLEVIRRVERDALVAARERDRPDDLQVLARRLQPLHAGFLNQVDERRRAAVHDRHFRRVQLDDDVVDAQADERRQQMLDRLDRRPRRAPGRSRAECPPDACTVAGTSRSPRSVRRKRMPKSAGAGFSESVTLLPE